MDKETELARAKALGALQEQLLAQQDRLDTIQVELEALIRMLGPKQHKAFEKICAEIRDATGAAANVAEKLARSAQTLVDDPKKKH